MTSPADRDQSRFEAALLEVHATLAELLSASEEQSTAAASGDRDRLEAVTQRQEQLTAQLRRAEEQRLAISEGRSVREVVATLPPRRARNASALVARIATTVEQLRDQQARTTALLQRRIELAAQNVQFLQALLQVQPESYGGRVAVRGHTRSLVLDGHA